MRENISFCFKTINNSLDKEHILSLINDDKIFFPIVEEAFNAVYLDKNGYKYEMVDYQEL